MLTYHTYDIHSQYYIKYKHVISGSKISTFRSPQNNGKHEGRSDWNSKTTCCMFIVILILWVKSVNTSLFSVFTINFTFSLFFLTAISINVSAPAGHDPGSSHASLAVRSPSPNFWIRHCLCWMSWHWTECHCILVSALSRTLLQAFITTIFLINVYHFLFRASSIITRQCMGCVNFNKWFNWWIFIGK